MEEEAIFQSAGDLSSRGSDPTRPNPGLGPLGEEAEERAGESVEEVAADGDPRSASERLSDSLRGQGEIQTATTATKTTREDLHGQLHHLQLQPRRKWNSTASPDMLLSGLGAHTASGAGRWRRPTAELALPPTRCRSCPGTTHFCTSEELTGTRSRERSMRMRDVVRYW